jgi:rhodanese-related sulfurtransferase
MLLAERFAMVRKGLLQMLGLVAAGAALGLLFNTLSPMGLPLTGGKEARMAQKGIRMVTLDEVRYYLDQPGTILVDARSPEEYALGHIPGALNLPADAFDPAFPKVARRLHGASLIIIYCSGGSCGTSEEVAGKLQERGFKDSTLAVFADGLPGWMRAKLPIQSGPGE